MGSSDPQCSLGSKTIAGSSFKFGFGTTHALPIFLSLGVLCFTLYYAGLKNAAPSQKIKRTTDQPDNWSVVRCGTNSLCYFWFMSHWWLFCCFAWSIYYLVPSFFTLQCHFGAIRDISEAWVCQVWPGRNWNPFALYHSPVWGRIFFLVSDPPLPPSLLSLTSSLSLSCLHPPFLWSPSLSSLQPLSLFLSHCLFLTQSLLCTCCSLNLSYIFNYLKIKHVPDSSIT